MIKTVLSLFFLFSYAQSARYLGLFPMASGSHYILDYKLMRGLAEAGHDVTFVSPNKQKNPSNIKGNFTEVILDGFAEEIQNMLEDINFFKNSNQSIFVMMKSMMDLFLRHTNKSIHHPKLQQLLQSNEKFDAVVMEHFQNDALKVFATIFNCPLIILFSLGPNGWINPIVGNPQEMSYIRSFQDTGNPEEPMTLLERTKNILLHMFDYALLNFYTLPSHNQILQNAFNHAPDIFDLYTNASIVLLNSHTSTFVPHPLVPSMVEIGGYHIDPPKKLPQDLQEFMDNAQDGVIYFSMGSNLKSKDMPQERRDLFINVLGKLKQKVIWKFEEDLSGKPSSVLIKKWLPQQDILAHPNIKLFITHGGLLSTTETIYHGVPILAIPVFGDQPANAGRAKYAGYGLKLDYNDANFTEERLSDLINELLNNPKYTENARRRSKLFHDRPMKPMDTAVFWMEYVVRNNGARHLRVAGINQTWYQYHLLDVMAFLLLLILTITGIVTFTIRKLYCIFRRKAGTTGKLKKQ